MMKECKICKKEFELKAPCQRCCSPECSKQNSEISLKIYDQSDKYKEYKKRYRATDRARAVHVEYRKTDKYKDYQKKFHNTDKSKLYNKQFLKSYRQTERSKLWHKQWNQTPKGIANAIRQHRKRRAIKNNYIETYTEKEWQVKLDLTKGICPGCKRYVGIDNLTRDHIVPISKASEEFKSMGIKKEYTINDMQPLCRNCNSEKYLQIIEYPIINDSKSKQEELIQ